MNVTIARPCTIEDLIEKHASDLAWLIDSSTTEQAEDFLDHVRVARDIFHACRLLHLSQGAAAVRDQFAHAETYIRYAIWGSEHDESTFPGCGLDVSRTLALTLADGHLQRAFELCGDNVDTSREVAQQAIDGRLQRALELVA